MSDLTLAEFLAARLDEDEAAAKLVGSTWPGETIANVLADPEHYAWQQHDVSPTRAAHITRHDPARVLREVEAGRARLALYVTAKDTLTEVLKDAPPEESSATAHSYVRERIKVQQASGRFIALEESVRLDAAIWCDHEDYRPEWR